MPACRSCNAPVRWIKTVAGKAMPLDPAPNPDGNVVIEDGVARVVGPEAEGERWMTHWATCPSAAKHRKPKAATA
ncbi:MAG TPA: hypothetical protein VF244_11025 [Acidimicrobiales bacterium]